MIKHRAFQLAVFAVATWLLFNAVFFLGTHPTQLIDQSFQYLFRAAYHSITAGTLRDFLVFGLFTGLAGFLVYVPNIMLMFLFIEISLVNQTCISIYYNNIVPF